MSRTNPTFNSHLFEHNAVVEERNSLCRLDKHKVHLMLLFPICIYIYIYVCSSTLNRVRSRRILNHSYIHSLKFAFEWFPLAHVISAKLWTCSGRSPLFYAQSHTNVRVNASETVDVSRTGSEMHCTTIRVSYIKYLSYLLYSEMCNTLRSSYLHSTLVSSWFTWPHEIIDYTGWSKILCAPDDLYSNLQVYRDFFDHPVNREGFLD